MGFLKTNPGRALYISGNTSVNMRSEFPHPLPRLQQNMRKSFHIMYRVIVKRHCKTMFPFSATVTNQSFANRSSASFNNGPATPVVNLSFRGPPLCSTLPPSVNGKNSA